MSQLNTQHRSGPRGNAPLTHEGAPAYGELTIEQQLRRSVCSCFLWEDEFYESGVTIADRILALVAQAPVGLVTDLAVEVRHKHHLRHVPLLLLAAAAAPGRGGSSLIGDAIAETISRPDEITEFLSIYGKLYHIEPNALTGKPRGHDGHMRGRLSAQVKKGLARAFTKFDAYQLDKYVSPAAEAGRPIRARDVMFLVCPRPRDEQQAGLMKRLAEKERIHEVVAKAEMREGSAGTWEVALISGEKGQGKAKAQQTKRETFERLLRDGKLGYLALLRNLRGMAEAGVDQALVRDAILARKGARNVLPFRYVAAARACPALEPVIDQALSEAISELPVLRGDTVVLVDVSRSMFDANLSAKSDLTRFDAGAALASLVHGNVRMFSFSDRLVEVPPRRGMAGVDALRNSQPPNGTRLFDAIDELNRMMRYDRLIVITDEQSHPSQRRAYYEQSVLSSCPEPVGRGYMVNVASAQNGVGYGPWLHIDGFSEQIFRFITEYEAVSLR